MSNGVVGPGRMAAPQWQVVVLCLLVVLFDGFDVQAIAFTAPVLSNEWGLGPNQLGPVFAIGLVGMSIGALLLGPLGDTLGRKSAILLSVATFALFSLLTATASSLEGVLIYRLLTGIGLGGALPNATALIAEYAPVRLRNLMISIIFLGIPFGGMAGGLVAATVIPLWGWQGVFVIGGLGPLLLLPVLFLLLPESIHYLVACGPRGEARLQKLQLQMGPELADVLLQKQSAEPASGSPVRRLFSDGLVGDTLLLWGVFFLNLMAIYFLISWIPSLLVGAGYAVSQGAYTAVALNLGGAIGPLCLAWLIGRFGSRTMLVAYFLLGAIAIALVGQVADSFELLIVAVLFAGFFTFGAQIGLNALAAGLYPTVARSTGVGWALGVGRIGSILGPVLGGVLLALGWAMADYFGLFGGILIVAAVAILFVRRHQAPL